MSDGDAELARDVETAHFQEKAMTRASYDRIRVELDRRVAKVQEKLRATESGEAWVRVPWSAVHS